MSDIYFVETAVVIETGILDAGFFGIRFISLRFRSLCFAAAEHPGDRIAQENASRNAHCRLRCAGEEAAASPLWILRRRGWRTPDARNGGRRPRQLAAVAEDAREQAAARRISSSPAAAGVAWTTIVVACEEQDRADRERAPNPQRRLWL